MQFLNMVITNKMVITKKKIKHVTNKSFNWYNNLFFIINNLFIFLNNFKNNNIKVIILKFLKAYNIYYYNMYSLMYSLWI